MQTTTASPSAAMTATTGRDHLSPVLGRYFERTWSHGEGHRLFDVEGRGYLDFANGIAVTSLGHHHPAVTAAIHAQVDRLIGPIGAIGYTEPVDRLAGLIAATMPAPLDTVFFLNSGSEAIEAALKLARRVSGRPGIVAFRGGFHGRTFGATSVTSSNPNYRRGSEPLLPGVHLAEFPDVYRDFAGDAEAATATCLAALEATLADEIAADDVAAILIEPIQGEGGYRPAPAAFLQGLRRLADRHGILLIADEVQSGYARTGLMWGYEHAGIVPDVVTLAKATANGLPLSAVVTRRELQERWGKGAHGTTFGGNPVACAAGIAVLETIAAEDLVANAAVRGDQLSTGLRALMAEQPDIGDVRGPGLMVGSVVVADRQTRAPDGDRAERVIQRCADLGLLLLTCGVDHDVIRWIAPIDVTADEIDEALDIFARALTEA
ncbi:MAG: aspartate aminotransferase family protein [Candidatus Limnocylindrales bacterium]